MRSNTGNTDELKDEIIRKALISQSDDNLEMRVIKRKGRCLVAKSIFKRGEFVCEIPGELIDAKLAKERDLKYGEDPLCGFFMFYFQFKDKKLCIDATKETGRLGRLVNHSKKNNNCIVKIFEMNSQPHLILIASQDIRSGDECLIDYGETNKSSIQSNSWLRDTCKYQDYSFSFIRFRVIISARFVSCES